MTWLGLAVIARSASHGVNASAEPVTIQVGTFTTTIPASSFKGNGLGPFYFQGAIDGVALGVLINPTGAKRYSFTATAQNANLSGTSNPATVTLTVGGNTGTTSAKAKISGPEISSSD
jgi:hypothetical protein